MSSKELCSILEATFPEGEDTSNTFLKIQAALEQLLEGVRGENEEGVAKALEPDEFAKILIVCAGHLGKHYWTNTIIRKLAEELLSVLCVMRGYCEPQMLLAQEQTLLQAILSQLQGSWQQKNWREKSVIKQAFAWTLQHLKHPHLSGHVTEFLPPILWMMDDYVEYNRVLALSLTSHLLRNTDPTEMRWHGRGDVLYQAVKPLLYVGSVQVVQVLYPCLLQLLPVIDYSPNPAVPAKASTADQVFSILITNLSQEPKLTMRRAYSGQLSSYIRYLGIYTTRHLKEVLPVLSSLLEYEDPERELYRRHALEALSAVISCCWPRMTSHQTFIIQCLAQLSQNIKSQELEDLIVKCLSLLLAAVPELKDSSDYVYRCCQHYPHFQSSWQKAVASHLQ